MQTRQLILDTPFSTTTDGKLHNRTRTITFLGEA